MMNGSYGPSNGDAGWRAAELNEACDTSQIDNDARAETTSNSSPNGTHIISQTYPGTETPSEPPFPVVKVEPPSLRTLNRQVERKQLSYGSLSCITSDSVEQFSQCYCISTPNAQVCQTLDSEQRSMVSQRGYHFSTNVIDKVSFFAYLRSMPKLSDLTESQYRVAVRRAIQDTPGYRRGVIDPALKQMLSKRITELGRKKWPFQKSLRNLSIMSLGKNFTMNYSFPFQLPSGSHTPADRQARTDLCDFRKGEFQAAEECTAASFEAEARTRPRKSAMSLSDTRTLSFPDGVTQERKKKMMTTHHYNTDPTPSREELAHEYQANNANAVTTTTTASSPKTLSRTVSEAQIQVPNKPHGAPTRRRSTSECNALGVVGRVDGGRHVDQWGAQYTTSPTYQGAHVLTSMDQRATGPNGRSTGTMRSNRIPTVAYTVHHYDMGRPAQPGVTPPMSMPTIRVQHDGAVLEDPDGWIPVVLPSNGDELMDDDVPMSIPENDWRDHQESHHSTGSSIFNEIQFPLSSPRGAGNSATSLENQFAEKRVHTYGVEFPDDMQVAHQRLYNSQHQLQQHVQNSEPADFVRAFDTSSSSPQSTTGKASDSEGSNTTEGLAL